MTIISDSKTSSVRQEFVIVLGSKKVVLGLNVLATARRIAVEIPRFWAWIATERLTRSFYGGARPKKEKVE
jgi:hypothetical protein